MEHIALYRQFRPSNFDEIVEQKTAVAALRQSVITGRIGHAYLFCGQRGTGKTSIARVFSRAINCESPENGNPCNKCATCKGILDGTLMDVIEIDAASNTSVENIKKICEEVGYAPSRAPHKIYIIDEVHMISSGAFNALLKTLEEPPAHAVFLFATTEPHKIPATILSRCQRYDFRRISQDAITSRLEYICKEEKIDADADALRMIASLSDGAMRDAISMLDQASQAGGGKVTSDMVEEMTGTVNLSFLASMSEVLLKGESDKLMPMCKELADSGRDIIRFALDLAGYFRDLLVLRTVPDPSGLITASASNLREMYRVASSTNADTLIAFIAYLSKMISDLKWSPSVRTSFEIGLIRVCGRHVKGEDTPLVIPDFAKKQAEAAKSEAITSAKKDTADESGKKDKETGEKKESSASAEKKAEEKDEKPASSSLFPSLKLPSLDRTPAIAKNPLSSSSVLFKKDGESSDNNSEKKDNVKDNAPSSPLLDMIPEAGTSASKPSAPAPENSQDSTSEGTPAPVPSSPADEEPKDPDDLPLENQLDIFSLGQSGEEDRKEKPEKKKEKDKTETDAPSVKEEASPAKEAPSQTEKPEASPEEAPEPAAPAPEGSSSSSRYQHTSLARFVHKEGIVEKKAPADSDAIWQTIIARAADTDWTLYKLLEQADFRIFEDSAYIVFEDKNAGLASRIKDDPAYRKVSTDVKSAMSEIKHVYLCTEKQYANAMRMSGGNVADAPEAEDKAEAFLKKSLDAGLSAQIHFGDD